MEENWRVLKLVSLILFPTLLLLAAFTKKMLPDWLAKHVAVVFFPVTTPLAVCWYRLSTRHWFTRFSECTWLGSAPLEWAGHVDELTAKGITGVVNLCDEYSGPQEAYQRAGIQQLHLPVIDHCEPSLEQIKEALAFMEEHSRRGGQALVHCKGGHGRSAAVAFCWLLKHDPDACSIEAAQDRLSSLRKVRKNLGEQLNVRAFWHELREREAAGKR